jgi:hypothetical protein
MFIDESSRAWRLKPSKRHLLKCLIGIHCYIKLIKLRKEPGESEGYKLKECFVCGKIVRENNDSD